MPHGESTSFGVPIVTKEVFNFLDAVIMTLKVESWSDAARTVQVRGFNRHGFISHDHTTNSDRSVAETSFRTVDFPLEVRVATSSSGVKTGQLFVKVTLQMGGADVATIIAGYVTDDESPCYPVHVPYKSVDKQGRIRTILGTNPAAGSEFSETVPTNVRWRLIAVSASLVASGAAANRTASLVIDDATNISFRAAQINTQTASQTYLNVWHADGFGATVTAALNEGALPGYMVLAGGDRIRSITTNLQAGDDWAAPVLLVEEWIEE